MRHYLYLEDRRIAYVCGCFKGGVFTLRAAKTAELTRAGDVQEAAAFLRSAGLAGKSVIAAVGGSETVLREMRLFSENSCGHCGGYGFPGAGGARKGAASPGVRHGAGTA